MNKFIIFAIGQAVIALGGALTTFGLSIWIYKNSGSISLFALGMLFFTLPGAISSPFIGGLVDRYSKKKLSIISDVVLAACTLLILLLLLSGVLSIGIVYAVGMLTSIISVLKRSSVLSMIPLLVKEDNLLRANGLISIGTNVANMLAPLLAGVFIVSIGLKGLMVLDLMAFLLGAVSYFAITLPASHQENLESKANSETLLYIYKNNFLIVWRHVRANIRHFLLVIYMTSQNILLSMISVLTIPLILAMYSEVELGFILALLSLGGLVGAIGISSFRTKQHIKWLLGSNLMMGLAFVCFGLNTVLPIVGACTFFVLFFSPTIETCERSFWQTTVPSNIQGRFFSIRAAIDLMIIPAGALASGVLAEYYFEPAMSSDGFLVPFLHDIIGSGKGRGIGLMFVIAGGIHMLITIFAMGLKYTNSKSHDIHKKYTVDA